MSKIKQLIMSLALLGSTLFAPLAATSIVAAQAECLDNNSASITGCLDQGTCLGTNSSESSEECASGDDAEDRVNDIIRLVINIFSLIVGVISVIMIIIGGLKYITSGGDSGNVSGAKNTILYAIIGLIVVALAQVIVRFVLQKAAGVE